MNKIITLLTFLLFLSINHVIGQNTGPDDLLPPPPPKIEWEPVPIYENKQPSTIKFEQEEFNFGTIQQGEKVKNVFVFTNTSDVPLVIVNAKGSCGCTVPEWPREPILPGESSQLLVVFDSKGKQGSVAKRVTITANTETPNTYLYLKGVVEIEEEEKSKVLKNRTVNENFFTIYPNPTSEVVNIKLEEYAGEKGLVEIFNGQGQLMVSKPIVKIEEKSYTFDISRFNSGIYTVSIVVGDKMRLAKQFVVR